MIKIIIKKPGKMLSVPGHFQVRTPCEIDVDENNKMNMSFLMAEFRKAGIVSYQIKGFDEKVPIQEKEKKKKKSKIFEQQKEILEDDKYKQIMVSMEDHSKSISRIEKLLKDFMEYGISVKKADEEIPEVKKKRKSKIDETVEEFIPQINLDNIQIKGSKTSEKVVKTKNDYKNDAEKLKKVIKEKE